VEALYGELGMSLPPLEPDVREVPVGASEG
jgi:hypothetical protein